MDVARIRLAAITLAAMTLAALGCGHARTSDAPATPSFEASLVRELATACPVAGADDAAARDACAANLSRLTSVRSRMAEPFLWGAQKSAGATLEDATTTRFNPLVWLKMYLSLEMFTGEYRVERRGSRTIIHASTRFRSRLDAGEYPYPFWHSDAKWASYQLAEETVFFVEGGKLVGALRSAEQDRSRPTSARRFDGDWQWRDPGVGESPNVVLYQRFFSLGNPHVAEVDRAFRAFEAESRQYNCEGCHRPDNVARQRQLEMLCYPNQALGSRHTIVRAIAERRMPPSGIADEAKRDRLLSLARAFESAADAALATEEGQGRTVAVPSK